MLETYATWIETIPWNYFCTFTTPYEMSLKSARRIMVRYHSKLEIEGQDSWMFWVAERFKVKDGYHIHALLKVQFPWEFETLRLLWQDVSHYKEQGKVFNRCDVRKRDSKRSAASYMFKDVRYVSKDLFKCDYDILV